MIEAVKHPCLAMPYFRHPACGYTWLVLPALSNLPSQCPKCGWHEGAHGTNCPARGNK